MHQLTRVLYTAEKPTEPETGDSADWKERTAFNDNYQWINKWQALKINRFHKLDKTTNQNGKRNILKSKNKSHISHFAVLEPLF